jgi:hypothetical protein
MDGESPQEYENEMNFPCDRVQPLDFGGDVDDDDCEDDDGENDDDELMNMEIPLIASPKVNQPKPATDFTWNSDAIVNCISLSVEAHDSSAPVHEWQPLDFEWKPQPVPLPDWARPPTTLT